MNKHIIDLFKKYKKFVIVATQMLDSLEYNLQPTRAEVRDVYYVVVFIIDATNLSGETTNGKYPVNALWQQLMKLQKKIKDKQIRSFNMTEN